MALFGRAANVEEIKRFVAPFEGSKPHIYLDTEGFVTVGIGNMLPSASAASVLAFVNRTTKARATPSEIQRDFVSMSKQPRGMTAAWYRQFTTLDLPDTEVNNLFQRRIQEFQLQLLRAYPKYDTYPAPAQLAMLDMAFNLGTGALKNTWPNLNRAIDLLDWRTAAEQCFRPTANAIRNAGTKTLFVNAAQSGVGR